MIYAIVLARGGSKGIPKKNILKFNGKPLIQYTIEQCINSGIKKIYTSSDDNEILSLASSLGSNIIHRPEEFSSDNSTSESAWIHAIKNIKKIDFNNDWIFAPQVTSPLRDKLDILRAISMAESGLYDSIASGIEFEDFFIWEKKLENFISINYDFKNRKRRQDIENLTYLENGSFYMFKPNGIIQNKNRLYGKIGFCPMSKLKMFQVDEKEDLKVIESLLKIL